MRTPLLLLLAFGLTGCTSIWNPTFMPAAYKRTNEVYKTAPGPEAKDIGYNFSEEKNEEILQIWRIVARDLVDTLEERAGLGPQPVYVQAVDSDSAFYNAYDHVLREELVQRGYVLTAEQNENLQLAYEAILPEIVDDGGASEAMPVQESPMGLEDYIFKISAQKNNALIGHASGIYRVPSYGYQVLGEDGTHSAVTIAPSQPVGE